VCVFPVRWCVRAYPSIWCVGMCVHILNTKHSQSAAQALKVCDPQEKQCTLMSRGGLSTIFVDEMVDKVCEAMRSRA